MDIWEANKLLLFIAFVIPGFVSLKAYELLIPSIPKESENQLIDAIAYSSLNYALLLWPIYEIETHNVRTGYPTAYIVFYVFVLFVAPVSWAFLFKTVRTTQFFQDALPHPVGKPWDYVFSQRKPYWVVVTLKNQKQIGGLYSSKSFASSAPADEQIYLEKTWIINNDGGFDREREDSAGVIIMASDIVAVELFNFKQGG